MAKELSQLIDEINSMKNMSDIRINNFLFKFKKGVKEEPEKIGELIKAYDNLLKKGLPFLNAHERISIVLRGITRYCFLIDNDYYEIRFGNLPIFEPVRDYLLQPSKYGPATKALSDYLECDGATLILKIFSRNRLN